MKRERRERIDHELQRELAQLIGRELKDPRLGFVTVTRVEVTDDLQHAKVFVSVIGDRHVARQSMDALGSAARFLRGELGHVIQLRHTPQLQFVEDRSAERAVALSKLMTETATRTAGSAPSPAEEDADDSE